MIKVDRPVIVEGKYDKIKLENIIDGLIIPTDGFGIFKNKELQVLLKKLSEEKGLIILTDSDSAGFMIRSFLNGIIDPSKLTHIYIPEILGKETRKKTAGAEGLIGVEGVNDTIIADAFFKAGITSNKVNSVSRRITKSDLYELGFSGTKSSALKRQILLKRLSLPHRISANQLPNVLNMLITYDEFIIRAQEVEKEWQETLTKN